MAGAMGRSGIWAIWATGAVLALLLILIGPAGLGTMLAGWAETMRQIVSGLGPTSLSVLRALAIALIVVFVGLCGLASRDRLRVGRPLFMVGLVFVLLVAVPGGSDEGGDGLRWAGAFLLALIASLGMTARLLGRRRDGRPLPDPFRDDRG